MAPSYDDSTQRVEERDSGIQGNVEVFDMPQEVITTWPDTVSNGPRVG